jgi:hypothetical protein
MYQIGATLWNWTEHSILFSVLQNSKVQQVTIALVLLVSLVNVLGSQMNAAVKFMSFAFLFVVIAAVT